MFTFPITYWGGTASRTFLTLSTASPSSNTVTYSSVSLGTAVNTSLVVVVAFGANTANTMSLSSISIAGVGATIHIQEQGIFSGNPPPFPAHSAICSAVTTSSSGNIVLTYSSASTITASSIAVYRLNNLLSTTPTPTPQGNTTSSGTSISQSITPPANGVLIQGVIVYQGNSNVTLGGASVDGTHGGIGVIPDVAAGSLQNTAGTAVSMTGSWSNSSESSIVGASWN